VIDTLVTLSATVCPSIIIDVVQGEKWSAVLAAAHARGMLTSVCAHHGGAHLPTAPGSGIPNQAFLATPTRSRDPKWCTAVCALALRNLTGFLLSDARASAFTAM
jgi:hypothetical protein